MARSINDIIYGWNFDSTSLTYSTVSAYAKWDDGTTYFSNEADLNATWKTGVGNAMMQWDSYSALTLTEETTSANANLYAYRADVVDQAGATGWFDTLTEDNYGVFDQTDYARSELVFDNTAITSYDATAGFREYVLLHESGHALGLRGDLDISGDDATLDADEYTTDMTVMSYFIPGAGFSESGGVTNYSSIGSGRFAVTPMAYDIAALVSIYGAVSANTGNNTYDQSWFNTYGLNGTNLRSMTLVDTGGTDEIDLSSFSGDHTIDLREAIDGSDVWQDAATIINDNEYVYIARGSVIENAVGGSDNDIIIGNDANNILQGGDGVDVIDGGDGDDVIIGGDDGDDLDGEGGTNDTVSYEGSPSGVTVTINGSASGGHAGGDTLDGFENLVGSDYADTLTGDSGANIIVGGDGGDSLAGGLGNDSIVLGEIVGGAIGDYYDHGTGDSSVDTITWAAGKGHDTIIGFSDTNTGAPDVLNISGLSAAELEYNTGTGIITFDSTLSGSDSIVFVETNSEYDYTSKGTQHIALNSSNVIFADGSILHLQSGSAATITGGSGDDLLIGADVSGSGDTISGGGGNDFIYGFDGTDTLNGGPGGDTIYGGYGVDTIDGGAGPDKIYGGPDVDTMTGSGSADTFYFNLSLASGVGSGNRDVITDFSHAEGDVLAFNGELSGLTYIGTKAFSGKAAQIRYSTGGGITVVAADTNADGAADFEVELTGTISLVAGDFALA